MKKLISNDEIPLGIRTTCPYMGLCGDQDSHYSFSHPLNCCHKVNTPSNISLSYQEKFCLTVNFNKCEIYSTNWDGRLPEGIIAHQLDDGFGSIKNILSIILVGIVIVSIIAIILGTTNSFLPSSSPDFTATNSYTSYALPSSTVALQSAESVEAIFPTRQPPTKIPTITPLATKTPTFTVTPLDPTPTPGPEMGMIFGREVKFVLYEVKAGESINNVALKFGTNPETIVAANVLSEYTSIWPGTVLVIIPGETDPQEVQKYKIVLLDGDTSIADLISRYDISLEELSSINEFGSSDMVPGGRWIIIPVKDE